MQVSIWVRLYENENMNGRVLALPGLDRSCSMVTSTRDLAACTRMHVHVHAQICRGTRGVCTGVVQYKRVYS